MFLQVTEAGRECRLCDSSVSTSVVSHCYLLLFYNMFQSCLYSCLGFSMRPGVKEHWERTDIRPKCSPEVYSPANKDVCKPRWSIDVLKQQHSAPAGTAKGVALAAAGPAEGVASLVPASLALAAKWRSALKPQVVATAFCVCITCTRGQIRCGFLNAFSSSSFQNVTAPVTSKLSWAIDRMSLLFFSSHAGLGLHSRLLY